MESPYLPTLAPSHDLAFRFTGVQSQRLASDTSHAHALAASSARFAMLRQVYLSRSLLEADEEEHVRAFGPVICQDHKAVCSDHLDHFLASFEPSARDAALDARH